MPPIDRLNTNTALRCLGAVMLALPLVAWASPLALPGAFAESWPVMPEALVGQLDEAPAELPVEAEEVTSLDVDTVVANLQASYDQITDLQADFTQESLQIALGQTRTSSGRVYFLRPGRMLWDYADDRRLVLDGEHLHSVDLANAQYYSAPIASSELPTAMRFLVGEGRLDEDFEVTLLPESTDALAVLDLVPHVPSAEYERLLFVVDTATWTVAETTIIDVLGNTNTIRFEGVQTNVGIPADAFVFVPDPALTRIEVPE